MRTIFGTMLAVLPLCCAGAARAQDCSLKQIASLPMTVTASGRIDVPVKIDGTDQMMELALTNELTILDQEFVEAQKLKIKDLPLRTVHAQSYVMGEAVIPQLQIGVLDAKNAPIKVVAPRHEKDNKTAGVLGLTFLSSYDVELDFENAKFNLFSHASCPGSEVYWAASYAEVPIVIENNSNGDDDSLVLVPMKIDGSSLNAELVFSDRSLMSIGQASTVTGVPADALEGNRIDIHPPLERVNTAIHYYHYPFKTLSLGGLALANPDITLFSRGACPAHTQWPPLLEEELGCAANLSLSTPELRKFHLYFAFGEGKLYVTAADAHK